MYNLPHDYDEYIRKEAEKICNFSDIFIFIYNTLNCYLNMNYDLDTFLNGSQSPCLPFIIRENEGAVLFLTRR